jgi:murein DD-endopeptidase MepM/ murein hydrolase activator NlpD
VVVIAAALMIVAIATPLSADTADELRRARAALEDAQGRADQAAAAYEQAVAREGELAAEVATATAALEANRAKIAELESMLSDWAVQAYVGSGGAATEFSVSGTGDVLDIGRRTRLMSAAAEPQDGAVDQLEGLKEDLQIEADRLEAARAEAETVRAEMQERSATVNRELERASQLEADLEARFAAEQEAARRAEQARRDAAARDAAARAQATRGSSRARASAPTPGANIICPINGAVSFVDSWGAARSGGRHHQGTDMMSPGGTPNVAVVSGTVSHKTGNLSGLSVYLRGDDGNSYYYFHLSGYEGPPRHVSQGEVVGYVGNTGNARGGATHTHFEYHPGGGAAVNPYPLIRPVC